jgi:hypothetical protein
MSNSATTITDPAYKISFFLLLLIMPFYNTSGH